MNGEEYYAMTATLGTQFGEPPWPSWASLGPSKKAMWEQMAGEQVLRERAGRDRVQDEQR